MTAGRPVTVQYFKYPSALHWRHDLAWLGEDEHGVWLAGQPGTVVQRGLEPSKAMRRSFVQLIPPDRWWTALFNGPEDGNDMPVYVDVATPARWVSDHRVEMIDLDLDVIRRTDGTVYVDDEDEFAEHQVELAYPPRLVAGARSAAARLALEIESNVAPFDGTGRRWLAGLSGERD